MSQTVAVLVPGTTGSNLLAGLLDIWPDGVAALPTRAAWLLSNPQLQTGAPVYAVPIPHSNPPRTAGYYGLIEHFQGNGYTYVAGSGALPPTTRNVLVGFGYDWRQPNRVSAQALAQRLEEITNQYPGARIWLIGHSMGGLVSRYLLESGMADGATWKVTGLITLGTPHLGAPLALSVITGEEDLTTFLSHEILQEVVDLPAYPSGFELLPPPQIGFVAAPSGPVSIYSTPVSQLLEAAPTAGFGAPASSIADAQAFFAALDYTGSRAGLPPYYVVYGSGLDTVDTFTYSAASNVPSTQLAQAPQKGNAAGDGIVPQSSALFTGRAVAGTPYQASGVRHGDLPNDAGVLTQIDAWIAPGSGASAAARGREARVPAGTA